MESSVVSDIEAVAVVVVVVGADLIIISINLRHSSWKSTSGWVDKTVGKRLFVWVSAASILPDKTHLRISMREEESERGEKRRRWKRKEV